MGVELDIPVADIKRALKRAEGVQRRLEIKGEIGGITVVDDYGHHPTEIQVTLDAVKENWPQRRKVVVCQPHRYTRTQALLEDFTRSFNNSDVLVVLPLPMLPGTVVRCRPLGVLQMKDEAGEDYKVIAVPIPEVTGIYRDIKTVEDLDHMLLNQLVHFFEHYKDLEKNKWVRTGDWLGVEAARKVLVDAVECYESTPEKPNF